MANCQAKTYRSPRSCEKILMVKIKTYQQIPGAYDFTPPYDRRLLMIRVPEGVMMML